MVTILIWDNSQNILNFILGCSCPLSWGFRNVNVDQLGLCMVHSKITMAGDVVPYYIHGYCTSIYTEVIVLLVSSSSNATLEYPRRYSKREAVRVLHGNGRVTSQEQHGYFSVGTNTVTV